MSTDLILENAHPALLEHVIEESVFQACMENGEDALEAFTVYAASLLKESEVDEKFETELSEAFQPYFESVLPFYEGLVDLSDLTEADAAAAAGAEKAPILQRLRDKGSALNQMVQGAGGKAKEKAVGFADKLKAGAKRLGAAIGRGVQKARKFMAQKATKFGGKLLKAGASLGAKKGGAKAGRGVEKLGFKVRKFGRSQTSKAAHKLRK